MYRHNKHNENTLFSTLSGAVSWFEPSGPGDRYTAYYRCRLRFTFVTAGNKLPLTYRF